MRPISRRVRSDLEGRARMRMCMLYGMSHLFGVCRGRRTNPEWHHVWTYGSSQIDEPWAIVAACTEHHEMVKKSRRVRAVFEIISLMLAMPEDLEQYPRKDWGMEERRAMSDAGEYIAREVKSLLAIRGGYGIRT